MIYFTEKDIIQAFPASEIRKAKPYAARDVMEAEWKQNIIWSKVKGTKRTPYSQGIAVRASGDGAQRRVTFSGNCSCPVGHNCKHTVAVLLFEAQRQVIEGDVELAPVQSAIVTTPQPLSASDQKEIEERIAIRRYFNELYRESKNYLQQLSSEMDNTEECLLWIIKQEGSQHLAELFKTRRAKDGSWSNKRTKVNDINRYNESYNYYSRPSFITDLDLEIARLFKASAGRLVSSSYYLTGSLGDFIVRKLLLMNRLFIERRNPEMLIQQQGELIPVTMQSPITVSFSWQENDQQQWAMVGDLAPELAVLSMIPTHPPYLIRNDDDTDACYLIPLITPFPTEILDKLLKPIWLTQKTVYNYWSPLYDVIRALPPLPSSAMSSLEVHQPIAVLTLKTLGLRNVTQLVPPLVAALSIRYDDVDLKPVVQTEPEIVKIESESRTRLIQRDLRFEEACSFALLDIGLILFPISIDVVNADYFMPSYLQPVNINARNWLPYMRHFNALQEKGWLIQIEDSNLTNIDISDGVQVNLIDNENDYALGATVSTSAGEMPILPLLLDYLARGQDLPKKGDIYLEKPDGGFVRVSVSLLSLIMQAITDLYDRPFNHDGQLRLNQFDVMGLNSDAITVDGKNAQAVRKMVSQLASITGIDPIEPPTALQATLRDYQQQGLNWLHFLTKHNLGGVLADDMGLGKTLQVIAHLLKQQELGLLTKPALVVAPTSVVGNWMSELAKFAPSLSALRFDGSARAELKAQIETSNVVLTSYALIQRDGDFWQEIPLHSVIVDEAQYVKNPKAKTAQVIRTLKTEHCLCLTGTPLENHLGELWSLFDFVMPGFLANETQFKKRYRTPIEQRGDQACQNRLAQRVSPFMLRRTKAEVVTELPSKTEIIQRVTMEKAQWQLYSSVRLSMEKRVRELMAEKGLKRSHIEILDALLKLRQVCCDPSLVKIPAAEKVKHSAKLEVLVEMVQELTEEGRKILVFSQFATMLGIIEKRLNSEGIITTKLTGQTRNRQEAIDAFVDGDAQVFLISLKAGGVGLNLTAADTVIHYDPWWNPAAESQATDRAYRIGQDKPVFVYKLIVENTVEEKILVMQDKKRALADSVFGDEDALSVWTDSATILNLFTQD
jgi:superfamily II DNA or RNA helicase